MASAVAWLKDRLAEGISLNGDSFDEMYERYDVVRAGALTATVSKQQELRRRPGLSGSGTATQLYRCKLTNLRIVLISMLCVSCLQSHHCSLPCLPLLSPPTRAPGR